MDAVEDVEAVRVGDAQKEDKGPPVTVVGGGIAGLTAAYWLAERGFDVTLYDRDAKLGGALGSRPSKNAGALDVYPHMFQGWYNNFWNLLTAVNGGADPRDDPKGRFKQFVSVYQGRRLPEDKKVAFAKLTNPYSASTLVENLYSGIASPADMFVFGYASIDLQAEYLNPTTRLRNVSLWGYLTSRRYMTPEALAAYSAFVLRVWGVPAYLMSAEDCRTYGQYCYAAAEKPGWLSVAPGAEAVIQPIVEALKAKGATIYTGASVDGVTVKKRRKQGKNGDPLYRVDTITITRAAPKPGEPAAEKPTIKNLVLAVPAGALSKIVRKADGGKRIIDVLPGLTELARFTSQRIPVLHLCLNKKIADLPEDPVALYGSKLNLAYIDISRLWKDKKNFAGQTMLALSCSEPLRLSGSEKNEEGFAMIKELAEFLPFEPGEKWKDKAAQVDWSRTHYAPNGDAQLTLNTVGTDAWRPPDHSDLVDNLFFAGDFCKHDFGITTVEAAVATGLAAANGAIEQAGEGRETVPIIPGEKLSPLAFVGMRYAWMATAFAAGAWSWMTNSLSSRTPPEPDVPSTGDPFKPIAQTLPVQDEPPTWRYLFTPGLKPRVFKPRVFDEASD